MVQVAKMALNIFVPPTYVSQEITDVHHLPSLLTLMDTKPGLATVLSQSPETWEALLLLLEAGSDLTG